jgi:glucokinase
MRANGLRSGNGDQDEGEWTECQLSNYPITQLPDSRMLLAGDIGGTKTLLGLFDPLPARPRPIAIRAFPTLDYDNLTSIVSAFIAEEAVRSAAVDVACFGVAGPVLGDTAELTNVPWRVEARAVARAFAMRRVALLNDLQAMAYAVPVLQDSELHSLQNGEPLRGGNMALIAAGTGLGQALLHNVGGQFIPSPCEGGHADFAARSEREITVLRALISRFGRASVEHVVSGRGLVNLHRVTHHNGCREVGDTEGPTAPALISAAALDGRCRECMEALDIFVGAYGAEAGNLALRSVSTAGLFIGGGIAPKILPALVDGRFMRAFVDKAPHQGMLARIPVKIILNAEAGLLGAAVYAATGA